MAAGPAVRFAVERHRKQSEVLAWVVLCLTSTPDQRPILADEAPATLFMWLRPPNPTFAGSRGRPHPTRCNSEPQEPAGRSYGDCSPRPQRGVLRIPPVLKVVPLHSETTLWDVRLPVEGFAQCPRDPAQELCVSDGRVLTIN